MQLHYLLRLLCAIGGGPITISLVGKETFDATGISLPFEEFIQLQFNKQYDYIYNKLIDIIIQKEKKGFEHGKDVILSKIIHVSKTTHPCANCILSEIIEVDKETGDNMRKCRWCNCCLDFNEITVEDLIEMGSETMCSKFQPK